MKYFKLCWQSVSEKAPNRIFQSEESSSSQFLVVCIFNWMLGQLRKNCGKVVCSWKSSELESTESCEKAPRPQPNSVFAQFSVVCMFNWMLGQLRKGCGKIVCSWKSSELESAEPCEENGKKPRP